jgi:Raf kinase inhibitor-like YbhB/YbcL family protein
MLGALCALAAAPIILGCGGSRKPAAAPTSAAANGFVSPTAGFSLTSPVFADGAPIPVRYTCDGDNVSPPLIWTAPPEGTASLALIVDDPDAPGGVFTHWLLFNVPVEVRSLREAVTAQETVPDVGTQGRNDAGRTGYSGPCPPRGTAHHYRFALYALNAPLRLQPSLPVARLRQTVEGHILGQARLVGTYQRATR